MKRFFYYITAVLICCVLVCCAKKSNEVVITGQLEGVEDGVVINLNKPESNRSVTFLSDTVRDGVFKFSFIDTLNQPKSLHIIANSEGFPPTWLEVWVTPGAEIKIIGKDKLIRSWNVNSSIPEQIEANRYKAQIEHYERVMQSVTREAYSYWAIIREAPDKMDNFKPMIDSLYAISDSMYSIITTTEIDIMNNNRTHSRAWMEKLELYAKSLKFIKISDADAENLKSMFEGMSDELKSSEIGQTIQLHLFPPGVVKEGDDMADADMWNLKGELCHLASYKGKYILLDFWSSGCGPCIMAIPEMKEISEMYKDRLVVVSISSDAKDLWEKTSIEKDITWVNLNDFKGENGIKLKYGVTGIPHYVLISPEGKVATSWRGYGEGYLKHKMEENLKLPNKAATNSDDDKEKENGSQSKIPKIELKDIKIHKADSIFCALEGILKIKSVSTTSNDIVVNAKHENNHTIIYFKTTKQQIGNFIDTVSIAFENNNPLEIILFGNATSGSGEKVLF